MPETKRWIVRTVTKNNQTFEESYKAKEDALARAQEIAMTGIVVALKDRHYRLYPVWRLDQIDIIHRDA